MKITLTGASGFVGGPLVERLRDKGHDLLLLGRRASGAQKFLKWDSIADPFPAAAVAGADAIIHLAGEPVAQRWSGDVKRRIRESRVNGTVQLVQAVEAAVTRPKVLISASAIGLYGDRGDQNLDELSKPGDGFLPGVCVDWEDAAMYAARFGVRVVLLRIGIVLHKSGGALKTMLPIFRLGAGGPVGSGLQWMSWIHRDDLVGMIVWALENETLSGAVNGVSPNPVLNADFGRALGGVLSRPSMLPAPAFALRLLYGEMASVILGSQKVLPKIPIERGYRFRYPELNGALAAAVS